MLHREGSGEGSLLLRGLDQAFALFDCLRNLTLELMMNLFGCLHCFSMQQTVRIYMQSKGSDAHLCYHASGILVQTSIV